MPTNKKKKSANKKLAKQQRRQRQNETPAEDDPFRTINNEAAALVVRDAPPPTPIPPSPTVPVKGLPLATEETEGFRALGKLTGAHRTLWRYSMKLLVNSILKGYAWTSNNDEHICNQIPLFSLLSKHQRLCLLREVAVGLLCQDTPLPPETIWHYAAFYSPLYFVLFIMLQREIKDGDDLQSSADLDDATSEIGFSHEHNNEKLELQKYFRSTAEKAAIREHIRRKRNKLSGKSTEQLVTETEEAAAANRRQNQGHRNSSANYFDDPLLVWEKRHWRRLLLNFFQESESSSDFDLPSPNEENFAVWLDFFQLAIAPTLVPWPKGKNALFLQLLFGPLANIYTPRDHLIHRTVKRSLKCFAEHWTPYSSAFDVRCLLVLMNSGDYLPPLNNFVRLASSLGDNDDNRRSCYLHYETTFATRGLKSDHEIDTEEPLDNMTRQLNSWSWAHLWHLEMQRTPAQYDESPDARIKAISALAAKISLYGGNGSYLSRVWKCSPCSHCPSDVADPNFGPAFWEARDCYHGVACDECSKRKGDVATMMTCRRCGVSLYCSQTCFGRGSDEHKKVCKKLGKIADQGKYAASLPLALFEEKANLRLLQQSIGVDFNDSFSNSRSTRHTTTSLEDDGSSG